MCADVRRVPDAVEAAEDAIVQAVDGVVDRLERGGRLIYVGAGTAGRLGMLDAAEAGPTFNVPRRARSWGCSRAAPARSRCPSRTPRTIATAAPPP